MKLQMRGDCYTPPVSGILHTAVGLGQGAGWPSSQTLYLAAILVDALGYFDSRGYEASGLWNMAFLSKGD